MVEMGWPSDPPKQALKSKGQFRRAEGEHARLELDVFDGSYVPYIGDVPDGYVGRHRA